MTDWTIEKVKGLIKEYPDFPKEGILFRDIFPIFQHPGAVEFLVSHFYQQVIDQISAQGETTKIDVVVGLDARGFLLGPLLAMRLGCQFAPVRKPGKLPGQVSRYIYEKEYGSDAFEMQQSGIEPGQNVVIIDDLLATGGSAGAAEQLVKGLGGNVVGHLFVVELADLQGTKKLSAPVYSLYKY